MYDRTLAIYCFVDDLLKAMQRVEDSRSEFSDAEVITTAIVSMLFFGGNFERARSFLHSSGMMAAYDFSLSILTPSVAARRFAIAGSAVLFAVVHVSVYGFAALPIDLAAGLLLSWQRDATGTWTVPAITHVIANALAVI